MFNGQMDNHTLSIFTLIENNFDFGLDKYTIFDEAYRPILNKAILDFYMLHEIGFVNEAVFKHYLNARMDLIMRNKYNQLYKAKMIEFNPLYNIEMHETFSRKVENTNNAENNSNITANSSGSSKDTTNSTSENTSNNTSTALALSSSYPSENMVNGDWENNVYVSGGQRQNNNNNGTENSEDNSVVDSITSNNSATNGKTTIANNGEEIETYTKFTEGSSAGLPFSKAMIQLKDYLDDFQLDQQVIDELRDLFFNVY